MTFLKRCIFILFFLLVSCSGDEDDEYFYDFPSLSQGQLIDLKKISETIEGFFITTDLSDLDSSWAERGFYLYVCIRFLNDETVNKKLNKSAVPLLIQVSNDKDKPEAESVLLLHPKTLKSGAGGIFYYEEKEHFQLADSPLVIRNKEYNIFDVEFNQKGKITHVSFIKKGTTPEDLEEAKEDGNDDDEEEVADDDDRNNDNEDDGDNNENNEENKKDLLLGVKAFAKQSSSSCADWPVLKYKHSDELPKYLQVHYSGENGQDPEDNEDKKQKESEPPPKVPAEVRAPISEDAPNVQVEQNKG